MAYRDLKMSMLENNGDGGSARGNGDRTGSPAEEIAALRAENEFLKKKLQLVGSVTRHDVLNQMTAIVGYNELLEMIVTDEKQKTYIEREKYAVDKIRRLFQFAKDYQNLAVEPPRWQGLDNAVHRAMEIFDNPAIKVIVSVGRVAVFADSFLDKALFQFLDNAARYGGTATEIRIMFEDLGTHAQVIIEDNGKGIPAADKDRIFERGYGKGTGWGLFLAREILAMTGITVTENGEPGKGARFVIMLPEGTYREGGEETPLPVQ
ncbi:sensor histidine kinase KdpD [Methanoregula sp.]|uniref:sensor histidine kinase n=1 Tax=Methanoregula sp. TaxID=2052170 RepID=UPI0025DA5A6D|nr:HAMP domain-containing sensor histidine kinase [Methanoregula sp.]